MKIYIVRHGETTANEEGRLQGWSNAPLNPMGILLAEETGKAMKELQFDIAFSSSLDRARQTAEIILEKSGNSCCLEIDDRIKEIDMGELEGKRFRPEAGEVDPALTKTFLTNPINAPAFPGGESVQDVMRRSQAFLKELAAKDYENVLIVTHGCALRCMLNFLYEDKANFWQEHVPYNCCVNVVTVAGGELELTEKDVILYDKSLCVDRYRGV